MGSGKLKQAINNKMIQKKYKISIKQAKSTILIDHIFKSTPWHNDSYF